MEITVSTEVRVTETTTLMCDEVEAVLRQYLKPKGLVYFNWSFRDGYLLSVRMIREHRTITKE